MVLGTNRPGSHCIESKTVNRALAHLPLRITSRSLEEYAIEVLRIIVSVTNSLLWPLRAVLLHQTCSSRAEFYTVLLLLDAQGGAFPSYETVT